MQGDQAILEFSGVASQHTRGQCIEIYRETGQEEAKREKKRRRNMCSGFSDLVHYL